MSFLIGLLNVLLIFVSLFLICLVLIQRGKGGGLAGAFGGMGGSSAFGTKAGDVFTRITIVSASIWFVLCMLLVILNNRGGASAFSDETSREVVTELDKSKSKSKTGAKDSALPGGDAVPPPIKPATTGPLSKPPAASLPEPLPDPVPPGRL